MQFSPPSHPSFVQIFSSALYSQTSSVHVNLLMPQTTFHIHTKSKAKLRPGIFRFFNSRQEERFSLDPRKNDFLKLMMQSPQFYERDARLA
jgi:hypothetical protein